MDTISTLSASGSRWAPRSLVIPKRLARKPSTASLTPAIRKTRNAICIWRDPIAQTTTGTSKMRPMVIRLGMFKTATPRLPMAQHNQPNGIAKGSCREQVKRPRAGPDRLDHKRRVGKGAIFAPCPPRWARGACHRAGPTGPASGRPDGGLRPDPLALPTLRCFHMTRTLHTQVLRNRSTRARSDRVCSAARPFTGVTRGLVPRVSFHREDNRDGRDKPGHDAAYVVRPDRDTL